MKLTNRKSIPTKEETAALNALQPKWVKWSECRQRYDVDRIGQDMELTSKRFIEDPSEANEAELLRCADVSLLGKQYRTVRETCDEALRSLAYSPRHRRSHARASSRAFTGRPCQSRSCRGQRTPPGAGGRRLLCSFSEK